MPTALEIIASIESQHAKVTEHVKTTGDRMNDIDAIFGVQRAAVKVTWSASSGKALKEKAGELLEAVNILEEGLTRHFSYEEKVFPIILGELLVKDLLHDHSDIMNKIAGLKDFLSNIEKIDEEELESKKIGLITDVNTLGDTVLNHARHEEKVLDLMKTVYEANPVSTD